MQNLFIQKIKEPNVYRRNQVTMDRITQIIEVLNDDLSDIGPYDDNFEESVYHRRDYFLEDISALIEIAANKAAVNRIEALSYPRCPNIFTRDKTIQF